jgi:hypothetical protein
MKLERRQKVIKLFCILIVFFIIVDGILFQYFKLGLSLLNVNGLPPVTGISSLFGNTFILVGQKCEQYFLNGRYVNDPEFGIMFDEYLKNFTFEEKKRLNQNPEERKKLYEHFLREVVGKKYHIISNIITYD